MQTERVLIMDDSATRIDKWLAEQLPNLSRSKIANLIKSGLITVENKVSFKGKESFPAETKIFIPCQAIEKEQRVPEAEEIPLNIVYEDEDLIIINKPINLPVHPGIGNIKHTLVNGLLHYTNGQLSDINGYERPGIVHRLDKDTSGLMIVCKNNLIHQELADQFKKHKVKRVYHALVWGHPNLDQGSINAPIGRHPYKRTQMSVVENGKKAITKFRVLNRYPNKNNQPLASELELQLHTGRTHQIRVHLAYVNLPIIGDPVYNKGKDRNNLPAQALFASQLAFMNPLSKEWMNFSVEAPSFYSHTKNKLIDDFRV